MIKNLFYFLSIFSILLFLSCSSTGDKADEELIEPIDINEPETDPLGSISGTIKLTDQHSNEAFEYQGTKIKLLQNSEIIEQLSMGADSIYSFSDVKIGEYFMVVEKEGYGSYDTLRIENKVGNNKLSQIGLLEFPKVDVNLVTVDYVDGQVFREVLPCFESDENLTIRYEYFFSKDSTVSYLNSDLRFEAWPTFWNTNLTRPCSQITGPARTWETYPFSNFLDAGFNVGDTVYVKIYPVHEFFLSTVNQDYKEKNFEVIRHIRSNGSNTVEFIL